MRHGAHSPRRVAPIARAQRRRFLAREGISAGQLNGIARAHLEQWARLTAKIELLDRWLDEHGLLDADGNPAACLALYVSLQNAARLALGKLATALAQTPDGGGALHDLMEEGRRIREGREAEDAA